MTLEFGKYRGADIGAVPLDYLKWLSGNMAGTLRDIQAELERRGIIQPEKAAPLTPTPQAQPAQVVQVVHSQAVREAIDLLAQAAEDLYLRRTEAMQAAQKLEQAQAELHQETEENKKERAALRAERRKLEKAKVEIENERERLQRDRQSPVGADRLYAEIVHAGYRALSRAKHPDFGGRHEDMVQLNLAYESLCQRLR